MHWTSTGVKTFEGLGALARFGPMRRLFEDTLYSIRPSASRQTAFVKVLGRFPNKIGHVPLADKILRSES